MTNKDKSKAQIKAPISPNQTVAARGLLGWSPENLKRRAGIGLSTLRRFEDGKPVRVSSITRIQKALEDEGIFPIPADRWGGEGVRLAE